MRRLACIGIVLLGLTGCENLPDNLRLEVEGSTLVFKKKLPQEGNEIAPAPAGNEIAPTP